MDRAEQLASKVGRGEAVPESFHAVDEYDGDVPTVAPREVWVEVYVDLPKRVLTFATGGEHGLFGLFAEMATGSRVERHLRST